MPAPLHRWRFVRLLLTLVTSGAVAATGTVVLPPAAVAQPLTQRMPAGLTSALPTVTAAWAPTWTGTLRQGMSGAAVKVAQERLTYLGYWAGIADGIFGPQTAQAVMAVQKTVGLTPTGLLGSGVRAALTAGTRAKGRTTIGTTFEIDLHRQLLLVVVAGQTIRAFNTSTGSGQVYYQGGVPHVATTPRGRFTIYRQIDGVRVAPLGVLYRPKYFYAGYAIHGASSIPGYPASHGCARLSNTAMNYLWSSGLAPIGRSVWIY